MFRAYEEWENDDALNAHMASAHMAEFIGDDIATDYSALMSKVEQTFMTGKAAYPVERTLLTGGLVEAGTHSLTKGKRIETPHLAVTYRSPARSLFWQR